MELEVGMYVRTIGGIERLKKENDNGWFFEKSMIIKPDNIEKYIIKASHNIIDLIEVGDYVNGYKVTGISGTRYDENDLHCYCEYCENKETGKWIMIPAKDIKSIVTKEQFENISYKVEG